MATCAICCHDKRTQMEKEALQGKSIRGIAHHHQVSYSSLDRHVRNGHVNERLKSAAERGEIKSKQELVQVVQSLLEESEAVMRRARVEKNGRLHLLAIREHRTTAMELMKTLYPEDAAPGQINAGNVLAYMMGAFPPGELSDDDVKGLQRWIQKLKAKDEQEKEEREGGTHG